MIRVRLWAVCVALACCLLGTSRARADGAELSPERAAEARASFERGVQASEQGDWPRARSEFLQSLTIVRKATTLFDLALSELRLGMGDAALRTLDELTNSADPKTHQHLLDRVPALRLEAEGLITRARLRALEAKLTQQRRASVTAPPAPSHRAAWLLGGGAAVVAASIGAGLWWHDRADSADRCQRDDGVTCNEEAQIDRQLSSAKVTTIALAASGVGLLAAGTWLFTKQRRAQHVELTLSPTLRFSLRVQF